MLQTILVYTLMLCAMMFYGAIASRREALYPHKQLSFCTWEVWTPLLLFAAIMGMRYDVGVDHLSYKRSYLSGEGFHREPIFRWLSIVGREMDIHYTIYFGLLALIQVFLLFYTFKKERHLFPFLVFVLFTSQFFIHWMNGIRQETAGLIFLFASRYIAEKKFGKYLVCCIIACGFHISAIILIPIYPILRGGKDFFKNIPLQLCVFLTVSMVAISGYDLIHRMMPLVGKFSELHYSFAVYYSVSNLERFSGLTIVGRSLYLFTIINIVIILYSKKLKAYYGNAVFKVFYNLYYFGAVANALFINNLVLNRPFRYFRFYLVIMATYLLYYLYKHAKPSINTLVFFVLIILFLLIFVGTIISHPFTFFWQAY